MSKKYKESKTKKTKESHRDWKWASDWITSIGGWKPGRPLEDLAPQTHWIEDHNKEKHRVHLSQPTVLEYSWPGPLAHSECYLFADDVKLFKSIFESNSSFHLDADLSSLEDIGVVLGNWNLMVANVLTLVLHFLIIISLVCSLIPRGILLEVLILHQ